MKKHLKIGPKIMLLTAGIIIVSLLIVTFTSQFMMQGAMERDVFNKLSGIRVLKTQQIEDYFSQVSSQLKSLAQGQNTISAMKDFRVSLEELRTTSPSITPEALVKTTAFYQTVYKEVFDEFIGQGLVTRAPKDFIPTDGIAQYLQSIYIVENPHDLGEKNNLKSGLDGSEYSRTHTEHHTFFNDFLNRFGFYDIFLIDPKDGRIVYSVFKELDFATSLKDGPYQDSNLATAFNAASGAPDIGFLKVVDFKPYLPSYGAPAAFLATPIYDKGVLIGVLAAQLPMDKINNIVSAGQDWQAVGLGESGQTYLAGEDGLLRSEPRLFIENQTNYINQMTKIGTSQETLGRVQVHSTAIGIQSVGTKSAEEALMGRSGTGMFTGHSGREVLASYGPLNAMELKWGIVTEENKSEAFGAFNILRNRMVILAIFLTALGIGGSYLLSRGITKRLLRISHSAATITEGTLGLKIAKEGYDEIGDLAYNLEKMRATMQFSMLQNEQQNNELEKRIKSGNEALSKLEKSESELATKDKAIMNALNSIPGGAIFIDSKFNIIFFNDLAKKYYDVPDELAAPGKSYEGIIRLFAARGDLGPGTVEEIVTKRLKWHEQLGIKEYEFIFPGGRICEIRRTTIKDGGIFSVITDISERKKAEHELAEAQESLIESEKMASLGGLVAGVAHEINTPLGISVTAITHLQHSTVALEKSYKKGEMKKTDLDNYLKVAEQSNEIIMSNLDRAATLVSSFKKVAVDQTSEEIRQFNMATYMDEVMQSLHPTLRKHRQTVNIICEPDIEVTSYPGALSQVVTNLVSNSLIHAFDEKEEGEMTFTISHKGKDKISLIYEDTGKGMPKEVQDKIFEPFFTTNRGRGGSGLGMHIIYNLITKTLEGKITCKSKVGKGSTFTIIFPREVSPK